MAQNRLKLLLVLSLAIYGCSVNNTNVNKPEIPVVNTDNSNQVKSTPIPSQVIQETSVPSNIKPAISVPIPTPYPTSSPAKQLSALEIKSVVDSGIVESNNKFGLDLFMEIRKKDSKKNLFISPASISFALSMAYNGADSKTKDDIAKVLHIEKMDLETVNTLNELLLNKLRSPAPDIKLDIANSLWGNKNVDFIPEFINNNKQYYMAEVTNLDFDNESSAIDNAKKINDWVSNNTGKRINSVVSSEELTEKAIDKSVVMYLINAIYFKANWANKFDKDETQDKDFYLSDGTIKKVSMMKQFNRFRYLSPNSYSDNKFQGIELPYGKDGKVSMYIFLPSSDSNLDELYRTFTNQFFNFDSMLQSFYYEGGSISLPKFKVDKENLASEEVLNGYLSNLGMSVAFDPERANFLKMAKPKNDESYYLSYVKHIANAEINEEGTEASAATVVSTIAVPSSSEPMRTLEMIVDHPFFFVIRDNETGQFLFMGSITNPES